MKTINLPGKPIFCRYIGPMSLSLGELVKLCSRATLKKSTTHTMLKWLKNKGFCKSKWRGLVSVR